MTGWKTVLTGAVVAIMPALTDYFGMVDWDALVGPKWAFAISGVVMIALRMITSTPIFKK